MMGFNHEHFTGVGVFNQFAGELLLWLFLIISLRAISGVLLFLLMHFIESLDAQHAQLIKLDGKHLVEGQGNSGRSDDRALLVIGKKNPLEFRLCAQGYLITVMRILKELLNILFLHQSGVIRCCSSVCGHQGAAVFSRHSRTCSGCVPCVHLLLHHSAILFLPLAFFLALASKYIFGKTIPQLRQNKSVKAD